jgi:hypothetical protein
MADLPRENAPADLAIAGPVADVGDDAESAATLDFSDVGARTPDGLSQDALETLNHARPGDTIAFGQKRKSDERPWDEAVRSLPARMSIVMPPGPEEDADGGVSPGAEPPAGAPEWSRALQFIQEVSSGDMIAVASDREEAGDARGRPQDFGELLVTDLLSVVDPATPLPEPRPEIRRASGEKLYDSDQRIEDASSEEELSAVDSGQFAPPTIPPEENESGREEEIAPGDRLRAAHGPTAEFRPGSGDAREAFERSDDPYDEAATADGPFGFDAADAFVSSAFASPEIVPPPPPPRPKSGTREIAIQRDDAPPGEPRGAIADFVLSKKIGQGGQGEVWKAWQTSLSREVAVKRLRAGDVGDFLIEAYTSGALDHPNIVPVHDLGRIMDEGRELPLLAMKLVRGVPWDILLKMDRQEGTLSQDELLAKHLRVLIDVCNAVAYAHSKGIIHRDLKPSQVMLGDYGEVFLMDWGLAMSVHSDVPLAAIDGSPKHRTRETAANRCGSPAYMAPEQTLESTEKLGVHTDVYLLGATLYEIVSGQPPHFAESANVAYHMATRNKRAPLPPKCPADLRALMESSLETEPAARPASAKAFRTALEDYLGGAGKKRESEEMVEEVESTFHAAGAGGLAYEQLALLEQRLERALQLWPDNASAEALRLQVVRIHGRRALDAGDLQLARTLAVGLPPEDAERGALLHGVVRAEVEQDKMRLAAKHRAWSVIGACAFVAIASMIVSFYTLRGAELRDESDRAQRVHENEIQLADARLEIQRRVSLLYAEEVRLAEDCDRHATFALALAPTALPGPLLSQLKERRDLVAKARQELSSSLDLAPPPLALRVGLASLRLLAAGAEESALRSAEATFDKELAENPGRFEASVGLGVAAWRLGEREKAALRLADAALIAKSELGERHPAARWAANLAEGARTASR